MTELNGHSAKNGVASKANGSAAATANGKASYASKYKLADHFIGGNKLENAKESKVKDFVAKHDGHTVITNVRCPFTTSSASRFPQSPQPQTSPLTSFSSRS